MKLLFAHARINLLGGSEAVLELLVRATLKAGYDVRAWSAQERGPMADRIAALGVPVVGALEELGDWRPDLVHLMQSPLTAAAVASRWPEVPRICTVHGMVDAEAPDPSSRLVVAVSEETAEAVKLKHWIPADRVRIVRNGVNLAIYKPGPYDGSGDVVYWGRVMPDREAAIVAAIDATAVLGRTLRLHGPDVPEASAAAIEMCAKRGVPVTIRGPTWDGWPAFSGAALVVANGRSALEAMAAGLPTWIVGAGGADGFIASPTIFWASARKNFSGRTKLCTDSIARCCGDLKAVRKATLKLRRFLQVEFSTDAMVRAYLQVYSLACQRP